MALKTAWLISLFLAEFLSSAFHVFLGCLGDVDQSPFFTPTAISSSAVWALTVLFAVNTFHVTSGGFITPSITLAAFIHKRLDLIRALVYFAAQLIGSFFGYALLRVIIPDEYLSNPEGFCVVKPKVSIESTLVIEFMVSFTFIIFVSAVFEPRNQAFQDSLSLKLAAVVFGIHLVAGPLSGGALNPARSLAPALYNFNWANQWIYWLIPLSAAASSSLLYRCVFLKDYQKSRDGVIAAEMVALRK